MLTALHTDAITQHFPCSLSGLPLALLREWGGARETRGVHGGEALKPPVVLHMLSSATLVNDEKSLVAHLKD